MAGLVISSTEEMAASIENLLHRRFQDLIPRAVCQNV